MKPSEREDWRYSTGSTNPIDIEEEIMFSFLPNSRGCKLLDVGCGDGSVSLKLQNRGFDVYGIDFSSVAVKKAKEKGINAIEYDVDRDGIPFENNFFDVVWAGDVIEHVFDPIFLFRQAYRVLKEQGQLILSVPNDFNIYRRIKTFLTGASIQTEIYKELGQCKHHTFFSWELFDYMLGQANFTLKRYYSILKFPKIRQEVTTKKVYLGRIFGRIFIVCVRKR